MFHQERALCYTVGSSLILDSLNLEGTGLEKIAKILPVVLKSQVRRTEPPLIEILAPLWPCVAGKAMSEHCRPVAFRQGTLTLTTECPTWRTQLQQMAEEIRAEVNSYLGRPVVKRLKVLQGKQVH